MLEFGEYTKKSQTTLDTRKASKALILKAKRWYQREYMRQIVWDKRCQARISVNAINDYLKRYAEDNREDQ